LREREERERERERENELVGQKPWVLQEKEVTWVSKAIAGPGSRGLTSRGKGAQPCPPHIKCTKAVSSTTVFWLKKRKVAIEKLLLRSLGYSRSSCCLAVGVSVCASQPASFLLFPQPHFTSDLCTCLSLSILKIGRRITPLGTARFLSETRTVSVFPKKKQVKLTDYK
jgi:hypothetical protein